jgi:D-alanyl-lipoteichoic acid acyltransferase DltB (MBOAT superfamily)
MLFNSYVFILGFLPITLVVFFWAGARSPRAAGAWLTFASLVFYGWWNPPYTMLLLASIAFNYVAGIGLLGRRWFHHDRQRRRLLVLAVSADLALLGYYKYANFFVQNSNQLLGTGLPNLDILLPLGISFFTFTQITYLVDAYRGEAREYDPVHYGLFVTYFPHLIAGPILHHKEMMPQFREPQTFRLSYDNLAVGLMIFAIGLCKKVVLADGLAPHAAAVFDAASRGETVTLLEAWCGALAYTFQLYFDFSGYSDMAVGLSRLFGVKLPVNFDSPYKSQSIIEFWRRWHMTLSRFLREYLYIPLGGNRRGGARRSLNLIVTMLLGGLWHGAAWTYVVWGGLHGVYLMVNQLWRSMGRRHGRAGQAAPFSPRSSLRGRLVCGAATFLAVVVAWVIFRADSLASAGRILRGMAGMNGVALPEYLGTHLAAILPAASAAAVTDLAATLGLRFQPLFAQEALKGVPWIGMSMLIVWLLPNTQQIMRASDPVLGEVRPDTTWAGRMLSWRTGVRWGMAGAAMLAVSLLSLSRPSEFLYFNF